MANHKHKGQTQMKISFLDVALEDVSNVRALLDLFEQQQMQKVVREEKVEVAAKVEKVATNVQPTMPSTPAQPPTPQASTWKTPPVPFNPPGCVPAAVSTFVPSLPLPVPMPTPAKPTGVWKYDPAPMPQPVQTKTEVISRPAPAPVTDAMKNLVRSSPPRPPTPAALFEYQPTGSIHPINGLQPKRVL